MTTGASLIRWIEGSLTVTQGQGEGDPLKLMPWQRRFLRGAMGCEGDVALTVARGAGKTVLAAAVAVAAIDPDGPLHTRRAETVTVASSFGQARLLFSHALAFLGERHDVKDRRSWRLNDTAQLARLEHLPTGAALRCLGSDPGRLHGLAPKIVICDEPAQWPEGRSERMRSALDTSIGKIPSSRLIAIGTKPESQDHWFSRMLRDPGDEGYAQLHEGRGPFTLAEARRACPSLGHFPSLELRVKRELARARRDPSLRAGVQALRLNEGVSDAPQSTVISADVWLDAEGEAGREGPATWGVDLSSSAAMSAISCFWPHTGRLEAVAALPSNPGIRERAKLDSVGQLYARMASGGELLEIGNRVVDVAGLLDTALSRFGRPVRICSDRWRVNELREALEESSIPFCHLDLRGQGYKDNAEDLRIFRRSCCPGG